MTAAGKIQPTQEKEAPLQAERSKGSRHLVLHGHLTLLGTTENLSLGGQQTAKAACSTGFHQTLSRMNREGCVSSDTKAYIVFLDWASCLRDLTNREHTVISLHVFYPQPCYKTRDTLLSAQCSASFSGAHLTEHVFLRVTSPLLQI